MKLVSASAVLALAVLALAVIAPSATASPAADAAAIGADFGRDGKLTPCRFSVSQLTSARDQVSGDLDAYAPGLRPAILAQIKRWKRGRCKGRSLVGRLKIVGVKATGGAGEEYVTIKNVSRKAIDLRGFALRDAADHTLKFRRTKLEAGRSLKVVTGCRKGHTSALRRGASYYGCRRNEVWDDAGDVVELLGRGGGLLATKAY
ncbi:MAG: lamin tail domain-containing protein [Solirubrobacteraceae bacterium]